MGNALDRPSMEAKVPQDFCRGSQGLPGHIMNVPAPPLDTQDEPAQTPHPMMPGNTRASIAYNIA